MFSFQAIHNVKRRLPQRQGLFIDYVNVLFSSNSQRLAPRRRTSHRCLSIMSMFSFQAIHNKELERKCLLSVVYRLCQCSLFKQFTTCRSCICGSVRCLSIMSMFSFQAIHNWTLASNCVCGLFIDYVNVLFSSNSQRCSSVRVALPCCLSIMSMFSFQAIHN